MTPSFSRETVEMFSTVSCKKHRLNAALSWSSKGGQSRVLEDPVLGALMKTPIEVLLPAGGALCFCSRTRRDILINTSGTLFGGKDFVARGPPTCTDRLPKFLRQPFGSHLGGEAFVIICQADEVHFKTAGAVVVTHGAEFRVWS